MLARRHDNEGIRRCLLAGCMRLALLGLPVEACAHGEAASEAVPKDSSTAQPASPPVSPPAQPLILKQISAGDNHSCGIRDNDELLCWGDNSEGQLEVPHGRFLRVAAGGRYTCAIRTDGAVVCWGKKHWGVTDTPNGSFVQVAVSFYFACALRQDNTVACWGKHSEPPRDHFSAIDGGQSMLCGLSVEGKITCWGCDERDDMCDTVPRGSYRMISVGGTHACAQDRKGKVICWGAGQRGDPMITTYGLKLPSYGQSVPPPVEFTKLAAGQVHTCGLSADGAIRCWGDNSEGACSPPSQGHFVQVAAGSDFGCGLLSTGQPMCWGNDYAGRASPPQQVPQPSTKVVDQAVVVSTYIELLAKQPWAEQLRQELGRPIRIRIHEPANHTRSPMDMASFRVALAQQLAAQRSFDVVKGQSPVDFDVEAVLTCDTNHVCSLTIELVPPDGIGAMGRSQVWQD